MVPLNYYRPVFDPDRFPDYALGPVTGSTHAFLVQMGIPSSIAGATVLHAALAYVNGVGDLESEDGRNGPIGVNTMISGVSGCGKTAAKDYAFEPMTRFHAAYLEGNAEEIAEYGSAEQPALLNAGCDEAQAHQLEPDSGRTPFETYIQCNATMEAILAGLATYPVANEIDDEFTALQTGSMTRHANTRLQLHGGQTLSIARKTSGRLSIINPRFTSYTGTQPHIRREFDRKYGDRHRNSGLGPRNLFVEYNGGPLAIRLCKRNTPQWDTTCKGLLSDMVRISCLGEKRRTVKFSPTATRTRDMVRERYQQRGSHDGDLALLPEHAARQPENIGRIAAGLHVFERSSGDISAETVERAAVIGEFFTEHYKLRFVSQIIPHEHSDAFELEQALWRYRWQSGGWSVPKTVLRDWALNLGVAGRRFTRAFELLCEWHRVWVVTQGRTTWVNLNAAYFR